MKVLNFTAAAFLVALIFYLLIVGEALLLPFVIAVTLWYLINTLAQGFNRLEIGSFRFPMPLCLFASFATFLLLTWLLINFLSSTAGDVMDVAPVYQDNLTRRLQTLPFIDFAAFQGRSFNDLIAEWIDIPAYATSIASSLASILASGGLILIYVGFLFLEQGYFGNKIAALVDDKEKEKAARKIINRIRDDIQKYIGIKVFTSMLTGLLSYAYLMIVGVDFAGVWGLLIFLLNFIPTVGSIIATIFPALIALAQSDGYTLFFLVLIGIGVPGGHRKRPGTTAHGQFIQPESYHYPAESGAVGLNLGYSGHVPLRAFPDNRGDYPQPLPPDPAYCHLPVQRWQPAGA
jgi:predicted PurR-regulated permease PerM